MTTKKYLTSKLDPTTEMPMSDVGENMILLNHFIETGILSTDSFSDLF